MIRTWRDQSTSQRQNQQVGKASVKNGRKPTSGSKSTTLKSSISSFARNFALDTIISMNFKPAPRGLSRFLRPRQNQAAESA